MKEQQEGESLADYDERRADENEADAERLPVAEAALTQCQHIAYDAVVAIEKAMSVPAGRLTPAELRRLAVQGRDALNKVNQIAEGGEATPEFVAMLAAADAEDRVRPDGPETAEGGLIGQQPY